MGPYLLIAAQVAAPPAAGGDAQATRLPDLEIRARIEARDVEVEKAGETSLILTGTPLESSHVQTDRNRPKGAARYRNLQIDIDAELYLDPSAGSVDGTTSSTNNKGTER